MNPKGVGGKKQSKELVNQHLVPSNIWGGESLDYQKHITIQFYALPTQLYTHLVNHLATHETSKTDLRPCTSTTLIVFPTCEIHHHQISALKHSIVK